jgi:hypothetical protein
VEDKVAKLNIVSRASDNTIGRVPKNVLKPHPKKQFVLPLEAGSTFVANVEDVSHVYLRLRDTVCPLVCLDCQSALNIVPASSPASSLTSH